MRVHSPAAGVTKTAVGTVPPPHVVGHVAAETRPLSRLVAVAVRAARPPVFSDAKTRAAERMTGGVRWMSPAAAAEMAETKGTAECAEARSPSNALARVARSLLRPLRRLLRNHVTETAMEVVKVLATVVATGAATVAVTVAATEAATEVGTPTATVARMTHKPRDMEGKT